MQPLTPTLTHLSVIALLGCTPIHQSLGSGSQGGAGGVGDTSIPSGHGGTTASGSDAGAGQSGENTALDCQSSQNQKEPGTPVSSLDVLGVGACSGQTLGAVLSRLRVEHPELTDVSVLYRRDATIDGNYVYAYQTKSGFAFAFKRVFGCLGDCLNRETFYFVTDSNCFPQQIGRYRTEYVTDSSCFLIAGNALWNQPTALDPTASCTSNNEPLNLSGTYRLRATGSASPCSTKDSPASPWTGTIGMRVVQDLELSTGVVTFTDTGRPLLDNRALPATFERGRLVIDTTVSNLPSSCPKQATIHVAFDTEGYLPNEIRFDEMDTPDCAKPNEQCKGYFDYSYCTLTDTPLTVSREGACTFGQDQTCNDDPILSALAGSCGAGNACKCNPGYGLNLTTGKCAKSTGGADAVCQSGADQSCNGNAEVSSYQGMCLSDGNCWCIENSKRDLATGKCVRL